MPSLAELKARSKSNLEKIQEKSKPQQYENKADERFWYPKLDSAGNGFAIIRFLPVAKVDDEKEEALPWVKIYKHAFKHHITQKWYIENSLTTFNEKDPLGEHNSALWDQGKEGEEIARKQKRKLYYFSNILVVKDPETPENEGKVFLFRYGKKIYDKILLLTQPNEKEGTEASSPFDFWTGRNFKLRIRTTENGPNYDASEWEASAPIADKSGKPLKDAQIEQIWEKSYSLLELLDRKHFKTYDQLKARLNQVLGESAGGEEKSSKPAKTAEKKTSTPAVEESSDDLDDLINSVSSSSSDDDTDALIDSFINDD